MSAFRSRGFGALAVRARGVGHGAPHVPGGGGGGGNDPIAGWSLVGPAWSNPGSLTPTGWTNSGDTSNGDSVLVTSGYPSTPLPAGAGPAARRGTFYSGSQTQAIGRIGTNFTARQHVASRHTFIIPSTYSWSDGYGGNKVAENNPIGSGRAYTVWNAPYPDFNYVGETAQYPRLINLALQNFTPVDGLVGTVELELDIAITTTVILDSRAGAGAGYAALWVQKGDGPHVLSVERGDLTFPGSMVNFYMDHTNNGNMGPGFPNQVEVTGSLYDLFAGVYEP